LVQLAATKLKEDLIFSPKACLMSDERKLKRREEGTEITII